MHEDDSSGFSQYQDTAEQNPSPKIFGAAEVAPKTSRDDVLGLN